jgi:hypothetical protein
MPSQLLAEKHLTPGCLAQLSAPGSVICTRICTNWASDLRISCDHKQAPVHATITVAHTKQDCY